LGVLLIRRKSSERAALVALRIENLISVVSGHNASVDLHAAGTGKRSVWLQGEDERRCTILKFDDQTPALGTTA